MTCSSCSRVLHPGMLALAFLLSSVALGRGQQIPPVQAQVLQEMVDEWPVLDLAKRGWKAPWDCARVRTVLCDEQGNVVNITIPPPNDNPCSFPPPPDCAYFGSIQGELPRSIGNLTALTALILEGNSINGTMPREIFNLTNLEYLDLSQNSQLAGRFPKGIGNLRKLRSFKFAGNINIKPKVPLPEDIGLLTNLTALDLMGFTSGGSIPASYSSLVNLVHLEMGGNKVKGEPPNMGGATGLTTLRLLQNSLSGPIPNWISSLTNLVDLQLQKNNFSGPVPTWMATLSKLTGLVLSYNQLNGTLPPVLSRLNNIVPQGETAYPNFAFESTYLKCPEATDPAACPPWLNQTSEFCVAWGACSSYCGNCAKRNFTGGPGSGAPPAAAGPPAAAAPPSAAASPAAPGTDTNGGYSNGNSPSAAAPEGNIVQRRAPRPQPPAEWGQPPGKGLPVSDPATMPGMRDESLGH